MGPRPTENAPAFLPPYPEITIAGQSIFPQKPFPIEATLVSKEKSIFSLRFPTDEVEKQKSSFLNVFKLAGKTWPGPGNSAGTRPLAKATVYTLYSIT